jgi:carbon monoxide dehydrogenase subunit G
VKLTGRFDIPAPRDRVFAALQDPLVLRACIPGCEELKAIAPNTFEAVLKIGVAGLKGTYTGTARIEDLVPPVSYSIAVDGRGAPGFVRGKAGLQFADTGGGATEIACAADVQVGGVIAAVGSRLIEVVARKMMDDFFNRLTGILRAPGGPEGPQLPTSG